MFGSHPAWVQRYGEAVISVDGGTFLKKNSNLVARVVSNDADGGNAITVESEANVLSNYSLNFMLNTSLFHQSNSASISLAREGVLVSNDVLPLIFFQSTAHHQYISQPNGPVRRHQTPNRSGRAASDGFYY